MKQPRTADKLRNAELARIHIARTQLGMDEDAYRDLLFALERVRSAKDLDWGGRKRVLEHFKKLGWRPTAPKKAGAIRPVATGQPGMIVALWAELHAAGRVRNPSDAALGTWLKRNRMPERVEWLSNAQLNRAIEALKKWLDRKD